MSFVDPITILQSYIGTIQGIRTSPNKLPAQINVPDMPIAVTWPLAGAWTKFDTGNGYNAIERNFATQVFVQPIVEGLGVEEGFDLCVPLLQAFGESFINNITLGGQVNRVWEISDTGVSQPKFNEIPYWGFEFRYRVRVVFSVTDLGVIPDVLVAHVNGNQNTATTTGVIFHAP